MDTNPDAAAPAAGPEFWRGLEEWAGSEELRDYLEREFPEDATEWADPVSRRQFVTLMGASLALAGATGCSPRPAPNRNILPYTKQPDRVTLGVPYHVATAYTVGGVANGVLVRCHEGRPVKVEGNPSHPASLGATDSFTQAAVLGLYDPDRSRSVQYLGENRAWDSALTELRKLLTDRRDKRGAGVRFLTGTVTSPTLAALFEQLLEEYPDARWVQYEPAGDHAARAAAKKAFGRYVTPVYDFSKADVVLALDADFLSHGPAHVRYARDFADRRRLRKDGKGGVPASGLNRLYAVESMLTPTGAAAEHRLPLRPSQVEPFARALAGELGVAGAPAAGVLPDAAKAWLKPLADDLRAHKGKCVVVPGECQPAAVHALAHAINAALDNAGKTVSYVAPVEARPSDQVADLKALTEEMKAGKVEVLFVVGANPVFDAPADFDFARAVEKVPTRVHMGQYFDETAVACQWHLPEAHCFEAWGDARSFDGTVTVMQPLIAPLFGGRSLAEVLAALLERAERTGLELVQTYWRQRLKFEGKKAEFETLWQRVLRDGVMPDTAAKPETVQLAGNWAEGMAKSAGEATGIEVAFKPDPTLYDGRFANNGWLQELPKPITKITWDNVALMSPRTAAELRIGPPKPTSHGGEHGRGDTRLVRIDVGDRAVVLPAWVLPGHADGCITLHYGFGRDRAGRVGNDPTALNAEGKAVRGTNVYPLRTSAAADFAPAKAARVGGTYVVACVQMHYAMEGRKPVRAMTVKEYADEAAFAKAMAPASAAGEADLIRQNTPGKHDNLHRHGPDDRDDHKHDGHKHDGHDHKNGDGHGDSHGHEHDKRVIPLTLYKDNADSNTTILDSPTNKAYRRWGMAVDTSVCTGCGSCVTACQAENNIPVVGKDQVTRGREMAWLRIDRYFRIKGEEVNPLKDFREQERIQGPLDPARIEAFNQPVMCVHCEKAPCEVVCPVNATVHSADGLNDMVYNRCVGTRYCSNNCPYKVRRFNFLTYADWNTDTLKLMRNPEVSVRSRGVMEKCTFCVQRIRNAEIEAEREWLTRPKDAAGRPKIFDGEIVTACQAACPTNAIVFGDIAEDGSVVNAWKSEPTNYGLLAELNTMPRLTHLAVVRNPNPNMKGV